MLGVIAAVNISYLKFLLAWSMVAVVGVVTLLLIEILLLGEICPLCSSAHVLGLAITAITVKLWMNQRAG